MSLPENTSRLLNQLAKLCYDRSVAGGWHEESEVIKAARYQLDRDAIDGLPENKALADLMAQYVARQTVNDVPVITKLALICDEAHEALTLVRGLPQGHLALTTDVTNSQGKREGLPSELADIIIRTLDLAGSLGIDIGKAIEEKLQHNTQRPYRHGGKRF